MQKWHNGIHFLKHRCDFHTLNSSKISKEKGDIHKHASASKEDLYIKILE